MLDPSHQYRPLGEADLLAYCENRIAVGSKSFAGAARLFDAATRASAVMLYAWCRYCDDVIDGQELGFATGNAGSVTTATTARLEALRTETIAALSGRFDRPEFQALSVVADRHAIPRRHPLDLIEGFEMDVSERRYHTLDDTLTYCYHVAGVVGVMMAQIMGVKDAVTLARASDLGLAFQLTNIARDVVADAHAGRVYLPDELLARHGLDRDGLAEPDNRHALASAVGELLGLADAYYASAGRGVAALPFRSAWAIAAARRVYRDIGRLVIERGPAAWDRRASTGKLAKLAGTGLAFADATGSRFAGAKPADSQDDQRAALWTPPFLRGTEPAGEVASSREP